MWIRRSFTEEETPEASAFRGGIVGAQMNQIVGDLPRVDIPQGLGSVIPSPKPYPIDPLFTPTPPRLLDENILMKRDPNR